MVTSRIPLIVLACTLTAGASACSLLDSADADAVVEIGGKRYDGKAGYTAITCSRQDGVIDLKSGEDGRPGLLGSISEDPAQPSTLTMVVDDFPYQATHGLGAGSDLGSITVASDGDDYTLTGTALGMGNSQQAEYRIEVRCGRR
ncbi:lipoprotein LpqH [Nocardioides humi]|uniref:Lipoprotein antigen n=1 Tax=Nocardioides humi TaxID=449461 RepID=A0ABN2B7X5_9ACTN|nr:lipoprotein LpqH [Nocardioides humi]